MKTLFLILAVLAVSKTAEAGRFFRRANSQTYYSPSRSSGGGYSDCYDYVRRTGRIGASIGTFAVLPILRVGDVLHMSGFNWSGVHGSNHWARVDAVNGGTITISHSNFGGNHGRVVHSLPASSFRGSVTVHR